jgi:hypothetical protein
MTEDKHQQILMNNIYIYIYTMKKIERCTNVFFFFLHKTFIQRRVRHLNIAQVNEIEIEFSFVFKDQWYIVVEYLVDSKKK